MRAYGTPTWKIIDRMLNHANPVTRSVYKGILGSRIDRQEIFRLEMLKKLKEMQSKHGTDE